MTAVQWYSWIAGAGFPGAMFVFILLSMTGRIRYGREVEAREKEFDVRFTEVVKDRDEWKARALHYIDLTSQATNLTETVTTVAKQRLGSRS